MDTQVDAYGRVAIDYGAVVEALYNGLSIKDLTVMGGPPVDAFNARCDDQERPEYRLATLSPLPHSPEEEHRQRAANWLICNDLRDLDVRAFVRSLCGTEEERARVDEEMDLFEERDLIPLLQTMICLVDHLRSTGVLWGVGRGSSVASFVLFKIGIHRINPMRYGLSIREFLKPVNEILV